MPLAVEPSAWGFLVTEASTAFANLTVWVVVWYSGHVNISLLLWQGMCCDDSRLGVCRPHVCGTDSTIAVALLKARITTYARQLSGWKAAFNETA